MNESGNIFPKVSIMIPTYNRAHYLPFAIESALSQDYPNMEIIVSDNCSTDNTAECMKKYLNDSRVRYYRNDNNMGSGPNYKKLLYEYAEGKYAKYLTDDDYLIDDEHISKAMKIITEYNVKIVFSAAVSRNEFEQYGINLSLGLDRLVKREWWCKNFCKTHNGVNCFPSCGSGTVFNVSMAREWNACSGQCYGDYELAIKCIFSESNTGYIKESSYVERRHPDQDGRTSFENALNGSQIVNSIGKDDFNYGLDNKTLSEIRLRGIRFFVKGFLVQNWVSENGKSIASFIGFLRALKTIDHRLPIKTLFDPQVVGRFIFNETAIYSKLRNILYDRFKEK